MAAAGTHEAGGSDGTRDGTDAHLAVFRRAVTALGEVTHRPELRLAELPAPKRLAPYAYALEASVRDPEAGAGAGTGTEAETDDMDTELADGRFVLLHDPAGQEGWQGTFRVVTLARTELEAELAVDPLLPEVTWSWLTGALEAGSVRYGAPSGTVTRSGSYFFGELAGRGTQSELELRASWSPLEPEAGVIPDVAAHLTVWCDVLCQCAGLPQHSDGGPVVPLPQRRGPRRG
ncbi:DUF3000 domain-containing protein [Streptomyces oceani]|uniref:Enoyl-CoA hydratase n=1 Tax=Streptomyces oceani TaxID=1075402 RepID=A0A1E7KKT2_9ACTN|nr:DUF3000 domain-containing protein [Streptomyces oceani]OEV04494.1 hypothetical protein AN216_06120 [Streptomyces oceani]